MSRDIAKLLRATAGAYAYNMPDAVINRQYQLQPGYHAGQVCETRELLRPGFDSCLRWNRHDAG